MNFFFHFLSSPFEGDSGKEEGVRGNIIFPPAPSPSLREIRVTSPR